MKNIIVTSDDIARITTVLAKTQVDLAAKERECERLWTSNEAFQDTLTEVREELAAKELECESLRRESVLLRKMHGDEWADEMIKATVSTTSHECPQCDGIEVECKHRAAAGGEGKQHAD